MSRPIPSVQALRTLRSLLETSCRPRHACCKARAAEHAVRRFQHTEAASTSRTIPLRAQLKRDAKAHNTTKNPQGTQDPRLARWNLTVGLEIHAELSTASKLFSPAVPSLTSPPNTHAALFDVAVPGAQPQLQKEVLLPALRAALALDCDIQETSGWDRKHYFWWDQPQGYQITQYYQPFGKNGELVLYPWDEVEPGDIPSGEAKEITIGIKQVQLEQDTAKTVLQPPDTYLLDFNRAGVPLVEIITRPEIKSAKTAAAVVKKTQSLLQSVGANSTGMEMGGLRCDVNVSVRRRGEQGQLEYDGVKGLGQRTEIKNLSSIKAVEDAINAERDRQIVVLESGGVIEGETRGWTLGATSTRRLRGKEGEVDYRYMPDPDLEPLNIGRDLVDHMKKTLPKTPTEVIKRLTSTKGLHELSMKDAKTLVSLDDGERLEFYFSTLHHIHYTLDNTSANYDLSEIYHRAGKLVSNWVLMELPTFLAARDLPFPYCYTLDEMGSDPPERFGVQPVLGSHTLAGILVFLLEENITQRSARLLLEVCRLPHAHEMFVHPDNDEAANLMASVAVDRVDSMITEEWLWYQQLSEEKYEKLAAEVIADNEGIAEKAKQELRKTEGKKKGKLMWLVGQMVKQGHDGNVEAKQAERFVWNALAEDESSGLQKRLPSDIE